MKKKVLITGGAGFIGSHLALRLRAENHEVIVMDNLSPQIHGEHGNSFLFQSIKDQVEFIKGDVRNRKDWEKAAKGVQMVVHLAAETGTGQSMYEVEKYIDVNCNGTGIFLDLLVNGQHDIDKVIVASSRAVYGEGKYKCEEHGVVFPAEREEKDLSKGDFEPKCPICLEEVQLLPTSEDAKIHPSSIYGITKDFQEQSILNTCSQLDIDATALRYQNVYGPGQSLKNPYTGILSIFSTQIRNGNPIHIFEDGKESRDFVFIDDAVEATFLALKSEKKGGKTYNVGTGIGTTVKEVAEQLNANYEKPVPIKITGNYRIGDIRHNVADTHLMEKELGFKARTNFSEGVKKLTDWVKTQPLEKDFHQKSIEEMKEKGLYK